MPAETAVALLEKAPDNDGVDYFFEGAEKLLEVWFGSSQETETHSGSLRDIPRSEWDSLMEVAACRILHATHNSHMDSYVLSESSLFVSDRRVILKTCGSTKLLATIGKLIELGREYGGFDQVVNMYYSRKNFSRPDLQPKIHRNFDSEMDVLDTYFEDSAAYCLGSMKSDRWYLYTVSLPQEVAPSTNADHTLEILMTEMPVRVLELFTKERSIDGEDCRQKVGIDKILPPGTLVHDELFDPCGYSMNGLIPNTDQYVTIHVTPEPAFSYVSFETNQDHMCLYTQMRGVLEIFKPNKFLMTIFTNNHSEKAKATQNQLWEKEVLGYKRANIQYVRLENEESLVYAHYKRKTPLRDSSDESDEGERSD